ncbi:sodium ion-translocating decarboxylase subunit beta [uncultured Brachyspira sp.]|uniref:sodium ion-translocating decarboxylase subunit beta n=1 Tax=uncultured Brachyspira sp. TaxID=221953 RepID=UPI0025FBBEBD|nr:sodium ion-translocating decarboxylase subunit beta [uncultured Brachyspira sp.]
MKKIFLVFALIFMTASVVLPQESTDKPLNIKDSLISLVRNTAFGGLFPRSEQEIAETKMKAENSRQEKYQTKLNDIKVKSVPLWQNAVMICVGLLLVYLAIAKGFEPLLLIPIGMGGILANIPIANIASLPIVEIINGIPITLNSGGFLGQIYTFGIESGLFPLFIFIGVGAMTDFGPLIANPKTALLGAAAQIGIFGTLLGAMIISAYVPVISFSLKDAASIGIIGGADGPTAIFTSSRLSPHLLGAIAVAAYSYMALVPIIQPPIMKMLTTENERKIEMKQLRPVSKREKIIFPLAVIILVALLLPDAAPLIGALMFGNLIKESGVTDRLSKTAQNELINIVTIMLGLSVGSKLAADKFLRFETLGILVLGLIAFSMGTAGGVFLAKFMNVFSKEKINPLIGAAGVSAVPMAARVANKVGQESNPHNFLLMHAMGPNVSGVIGSAVAAGVLLAILG